MAITWGTEYGVSPEDHRRGRGGFNGEYFAVRGITDRKFATSADAEAAIAKRFPKWTRSEPQNMPGVVFTDGSGARHLCIYEITVMYRDGVKVSDRPSVI